MKKKALAMLLSLVMMVAMLPSAFAAEMPFTDVADDFWAEDEISWAYEEGLMNGNSETTFNPNGKVTRQQVWMILARMSGYAPEDMAAAKGWAVSTGVSDGSNPGNPVTRQQLVTLIWRAEGEPTGDVTVLADYPDAGSVSSYAKEAMAWAVENGVIGGTTAGTLNPQGNANRTQLAVILYRFCGQEAAAETYTVTFQLNYGDEGVYKTVKVEDGDTVKEPSDPSRSGYTFKGWYTKATSGTKFDFDTEITKDVTLYAQWTKTSSGGSSGGSSHSHSYGAWTPNGDGTHSRDYNCGHVGSQTANCSYGVPVEAGEVHTKTCSVCNDTVTEYHDYGTDYKCICGADVTPTEGETEHPVAVLNGKGYITLSGAVADAVSGDTITLLKDTAETQISVGSAKEIAIIGGSTDVSFTGQFKVSGTLNLSNLTVCTPTEAVAGEVSQYSKSAIALVNSGDVVCENVTFEMKDGVPDATAITAWWSTGDGANITVKNCVFNCDGERPIRSDACVTVENCTFNDPYRYAVQMTSKASTMDADADAYVIFKNNTINNGANGKNFVYGVQLEGGYGCSDLTITGTGNEIVAGEWDTANESAMYYCECGEKIDHNTIAWNTEVPAVHANFAAVAMIDGVEYATLQAAVDAVQNGETIVILEGTHNEVMNVRGGKTFTVKAEEGKEVVVAGIAHESNGPTPSTVTFENLTINNAAATGWFTGTANEIAPCVGIWGGNLTFNSCTFEIAGTSGKETGVMTWWATNPSTELTFNQCVFNGIENHTSARAMQIYGAVDLNVTNCTFNTYKDYSLKYVGAATNSATLNGNKVYNTQYFVELGSSLYSGADYTVYINDTTLGENVNYYVIGHEENQTVVIDGKQWVSSAKELATALTSTEEIISVVLTGDIDLPITSLGSQTPGSGEYKLGGESTEAITIDLNGHKLNITTGYWSGIGAKNANATFTIKNGTMTSSQASGTWNSYDVTFANCNYVIEKVIFDKAVAFVNEGKSVTMNDVTINETHDYYALWITAEGQDVTIDGLTVNSAGRGIKIDEQYVGTDAKAKVTLNVSNAKFTTAKKSAILVKSATGADIKVANVDISNVAADTVNAVWVDADAAAYADLVTVTGATKITET